MYQFIRALRFKDTMAFKEQFRSVDVLMIDDVQFISGKDSTQEEFFHTFNALVDQNRQIVISADKSPSDLEGMEERMRSRLGWGLVADIHPTTYELRLGILAGQGRADEDADPRSRCWNSSRTRSRRTCASSKARSTASSPMPSSSAAPVTLESAQEVLHDLLRANDRRVTIDEIQKRVAEHYNIRLADMHSARRARAVARPRQVAMYLCKQLTPRSLPGDRAQVRRARPHHGDARRAQDRGAACCRPRHRRGCRAAAADARDVTATLGRAPPFRQPRPTAALSFTSEGMACYSAIPFAPAGFRAGRRGRGEGDFARRHIRHNRPEPVAMKLTIERAALLRALGHVQSVVERRNTIPILSNVLLRAERGPARALRHRHGSRDRRLGGRRRRSRKGATTAPAHTLYDIVRKLREGAQVEIEAASDKGSLSLRSGRSSFTLACLPSEDYPLMAGGELPHGFTLSAADLKRLIDRTRFAISTEETRYYLNGIYLPCRAQQRRADAARGGDRRPSPGADGDPAARRRRRHAGRHRAAQDGDGAAQAASTRWTRTCRSRSPTPRSASASAMTVLTSKLIDGTFPDYDRVIPTGNDKHPRGRVQALRRGGRPRLDHLDREEPRREAHASSMAASRSRRPAPRTAPPPRSSRCATTPTPLEIGFNSRYLLDIAEQIEGEGARFAMADGGLADHRARRVRPQRALRPHADARLRRRRERAMLPCEGGPCIPIS